MVSGFEALVIVLLIGGLIVPIWALVATVHFANRKQRSQLQSAQRCMAFTALMDRLTNELRGDRKRAPIVLACIRELQTFPEYRDISVTMINDINVTRQHALRPDAAQRTAEDRGLPARGKHMSNYRIHGATGEWEVVIGLEVHAQVTSHAKLFSGASTAFGAEPNTQV